MMMLPIVASVASLTGGHGERGSDGACFHTCLLLSLAYGCSIGGIATLMGTPPNGFMAGFVQQELGIEISYGAVAPHRAARDGDHAPALLGVHGVHRDARTDLACGGRVASDPLHAA